MAVLLLFLLILTSLSMILWGLWEQDRIYQFPTLAGVAWLGYIVPQAIGVLNNPRSVPSRALTDGGLELALLMSVLCAAMGFLGYVSGPRGVARPSASPSYSYDRIFLFGCLLCAIAFCAFHHLAQLCGGYLAYFSTQGAYSLHWRGRPVVFAFFTKMIFPGLLLCLAAALNSRSAIKWIGVGMACVLPLANTIFLGRRQNTIVLLLVFAVTFYFAKRWTPPRAVSILAMILGSLMIIVAPAYRANTQLGADHSQLRHVDVRQRIEDKLQGRRTWVFENAVVQMAAVRRAGLYGMGRGLYNRSVTLLVPRLITGDQIKEKLLLPAPDHRDLTWRYYRWVTKYGTYSTGACDAFREFWFFGALVFFVLGRGFRALWNRAQLPGSVAAQLLYVSFCVTSMTSVVNNIGGIPAQFAFVVAFLYPIICLSRMDMGRTAPLSFSSLPSLGSLSSFKSFERIEIENERDQRDQRDGKDLGCRTATLGSFPTKT
jgi:hypothetical protein